MAALLVVSASVPSDSRCDQLANVTAWKAAGGSSVLFALGTQATHTTWECWVRDGQAHTYMHLGGTCDSIGRLDITEPTQFAGSTHGHLDPSVSKVTWRGGVLDGVAWSEPSMGVIEQPPPSTQAKSSIDTDRISTTCGDSYLDCCFWKQPFLCDKKATCYCDEDYGGGCFTSTCGISGCCMKNTTVEEEQ